MSGARMTLLGTAVLAAIGVRAVAGQDPQSDPWVVRQLGSGRLMHEGLITRAVFSHDSSKLIVADHSRRLRFWSVDDGRLTRTYEHGAPLNSVAASADGKWIAVSDAEHKVLLLEARTLAIRAEAVVSAELAIFALNFFPDSGRLLVGGFGERSFITLNVPALDRVSTHKLPEGERLLDVAISPDAASLWACTSVHGDGLLLVPTNSRLRRYEPGAEEASELLLNDAGRTWSLRFADGGRSIVTVEREPESDDNDARSGQRHYLRIYDARTLTRTASFPFGDRATAFEVSPDGRWVAAPDRRTEISVWDIKSGRLAREFPLRSRALGLAFSPNGRWLAGYGARRVSIWDLTTGALHVAGEGHDTTIRSVHFSTDGRLVLAENGMEVRRWDWRTGEAWPLPDLPEFASVAVDLSQRVLVTAREETVHFHDPVTGAERQTIQFDGAKVGRLRVEPRGAGLVVETQDAVTEQYTLRVLSPDASASRWEERQEVRGNINDAFAWSPDQRAVATATWWDEQQLRIVPLLPDVPIVVTRTRSRLERIAFTPGGDQVIAQRPDRIDVFDAASGRRMERVRVPDLRWMDVIHATGECVLVRNRYDFLAPIEGILEVRPAPGGSPTLTCRIARRSIEHVAVSPNGQSFAVVLIERDAETFEFREREIAVIQRSDDGGGVLRRVTAPLSADAMEFSPDSNCLAVALRTGVVEIWDVARLPLDHDR